MIFKIPIEVSLKAWESIVPPEGRGFGPGWFERKATTQPLNFRLYLPHNSKPPRLDCYYRGKRAIIGEIPLENDDPILEYSVILEAADKLIERFNMQKATWLVRDESGRWVPEP